MNDIDEIIEAACEDIEAMDCSVEECIENYQKLMKRCELRIQHWTAQLEAE